MGANAGWGGGAAAAEEEQNGARAKGERRREGALRTGAPALRTLSGRRGSSAQTDTRHRQNKPSPHCPHRLRRSGGPLASPAAAAAATAARDPGPPGPQNGGPGHPPARRKAAPSWRSWGLSLVFLEKGKGFF